MPRYVALLRGINVGGHRLKMAHLRRLFEELGFDEVASVIASGNVIFSADSCDVEAIRAKIERHLARELGYDVATFIRSAAELEAIAAFAHSSGAPERAPASAWYVVFLPAPADEGLRARFADLRSEIDDFVFSGREMYWLIQGKLTNSPLFGAGLDKVTRGVPTTTRNMTTVRRLVEKLQAVG
jgi:uncharacterized protein (DUF1697 family)